MYGRKLSATEIAARMQELRNLRMLHAHDREQITELKKENKELRQLLESALQQNKTQAMQIAELQTMVFGKKRRPPTGHHEAVSNQPVPLVRGSASYRRPLPPASAITSEVSVPLPEQCPCGGRFGAVTIHERFEEDIPLPDLTPGYTAHLVTKYVVERGVCLSCGKASSARELGGQPVRLGTNIRLLVSHLTSVVGLSYAQITHVVLSLYGLHLTDGEIANLLTYQHEAWLPAYSRLQADIRSSPSVHVDETSWPVQALNRQGYAWVMAASGNQKSCFVLANSRGAPHAQKLLNGYTGIRITDDYGVYRNPELQGSQQLCWAHLYRVIRDLTYNENLPKEHEAYVRWWYGQLAAIYEDLRLYLTEPFELVVRATQAQELWQRVQALCSPRSNDPKKLTNLKAQLTRAGQDKLFICLPKDTPCDNNRAERDLRGLVLKRKRSFGSKTEKGAKALATILSICTTTWRANPTGYFAALAAV
jgi:transposase